LCIFEFHLHFNLFLSEFFPNFQQMLFQLVNLRLSKKLSLVQSNLAVYSDLGAYGQLVMHLAIMAL